ncbi:MAG: GNAT family N-acetyltransferase [Chromatiales bacterium]|nr:GNAT family N-acetyltransferase [Chromatiales bacterium]
MDPPYVLRQVTAADLDALMAIGHAAIRPHVEALEGTWDAPRHVAAFRRAFDPPNTRAVQVGGRDVGYLHVVEHPGHVQIEGVYLDAAHRGRGIGARLVREVVARAHAAGKPVRLRVLPTNPARRLYTRLGFSEYERTPTRILMTTRPVGASTLRRSDQSADSRCTSR